MAEALELALSFTAIDAASGMLSRLESRLSALGKAGEVAQGNFNAMRDNFNKGLQGIGMAWSGWKLMEPGIEAAAELQRAGLETRNFLEDGAKSAAQIGKELRAVNRTSINISENQPISAAHAAEFQNSLLKKGFAAEMATGAAPAALALAQLRKASPESIAELSELFKEQFGTKTSSDMSNALDMVAKANVDPEEVRSALARTGQQMHSMGLSLNEAITVAGMLKGISRPGAALDSLLGSVLNTYADPQSTSSQYARALGLSFFHNNKFVGLANVQEQLKKTFSGMENATRLGYLKKAFPESGADVADKLFNSESIKEFSEAAAKRKAAVAQLNIQNKSLLSTLNELGNAWHNLLGQMYTPLMPAISAPLEQAKNAVSKTGNFLGDHSVVAGSLGVGLAGILGYGIYKTLKHFGASLSSAMALRGNMSSLGISLFGSAAVDKAHQALTGEKSTSVFVTNWPPSLLLNSGSVAVATSAAGKVTDKLLGGKLPGTGGIVAGGAGAAGGGLLARIGPALLGASAGILSLLATGAGTAFSVAPILATILTGLSLLAGVGIAKLLTAGGNFAADKTGIHPWEAVTDWAAKLAESRARENLQTAYSPESATFDNIRAMNKINNQVQISLYVDKDGRVISNTSSPNTAVSVQHNAARGNHGL